MPDRLTELKRQRALVAEHLQWLDREIGLSEPTPADEPHPPLNLPLAANVSVPPPPPFLARASPSAGENRDPTLALLQEAERQRGQVSKSGCWIVFATLLLIGVGGITAYILFRYR